MDKNIYLEKVKKLFSKRSSMEVFIEAIQEILPSEENWKTFFVIVFSSIVPAVIIGISENTVELFIKSVSNLNSIVLALFGIVFTGYAFFQALINTDLLKRLITADGKGAKKQSKLQESNEYFVNVMMLDISAIIINAFLLVVVGSLPKNFHLPLNNVVNNTIAAIAILVYFSYIFLIIWEMKSFVFNIFQLFNAHSGSKAIEILNNENKDE